MSYLQRIAERLGQRRVTFAHPATGIDRAGAGYSFPAKIHPGQVCAERADPRATHGYRHIALIVGCSAAFLIERRASRLRLVSNPRPTRRVRSRLTQDGRLADGSWRRMRRNPSLRPPEGPFHKSDTVGRPFRAVRGPDGPEGRPTFASPSCNPIRTLKRTTKLPRQRREKSLPFAGGGVGVCHLQENTSPPLREMVDSVAAQVRASSGGETRQPTALAASPTRRSEKSQKSNRRAVFYSGSFSSSSNVWLLLLDCRQESSFLCLRLLSA